MALTARQKKAIEFYLKGDSKEDAMLKAGYAITTSKTKHSDIFNTEAVGEITRRQNIAAARTDITLEWALGELKKIAEADLGDIIEVAEDGSYKINMAKLGPNLRKAMNGFTVDDMQEGRGEDGQKFRRLKVNLVDKVRAFELIIRHGGLSKEKVIVEVEGDLVERLQRGRSRVRPE